MTSLRRARRGTPRRRRAPRGRARRTPTADPEPTRDSLLSSTAVMAAGTVVSRLSGFVRGILLAAALGVGLHADVFNIANTVPNMLYILLAGGVMNAVLVPQLVRAMKNDPDGGEAYTNRIITLAGAVPGGRDGGCSWSAAPLLMRLFLDPEFFTPELAAQRDSVIDFARYCLPQVFFYGMFVLVGQVLNSRGRFGPMMWAPIANNVVAVAVLDDVPDHHRPGRRARRRAAGSPPAPRPCSASARRSASSCSSSCCCPTCKAAGFSYRPRFDFRGTGLGPHPPPRHVDGAVRGGQPDRLHRRRTPRQQRHVGHGGAGGPGLRGDRLHDLLQLVPADDGPALDHHRLPGHGDAAAAVAVRRRRATSPRSARRSPRPSGRPTRWSFRSRRSSR